MSTTNRNIRLADIRHVRIFYDENMYAAHTNRGGIWSFGDGEIAVAHLLKPADYKTGEGVHHGYSSPGAGVMLNRSYDSGETWPEAERRWIWNNDRSVEEIRSWLYDRPEEYEEIDMSNRNSIMHFCTAHYLLKRKPGIDPIHHGFSFCLRSKDKGHTWESKPSLVPPPSFSDSLIAVNLGYIKFPNGVLGIGTSGAFYYVSYDQGLSWDFVSTVASDPLHQYEYSYAGVHRLPDDRLLFSMHRLVRPFGDYPCVAFSDDGGLTWSKPKYIVRPDWVPPEALPEPGQVELPTQSYHWFDDTGRPHNEISAYRSPCALVTRDGRIVVIFARRRPPYGIGGVVSDDLGETWSQEFVLRADGCCGDCGYPVVTELDDGRIFTAYYISVSDSEGTIPSIRQDRGTGQLAWSAVRYVAGTSFRIEK